MKVMLVSGSFPPMKCGVGDYTYQLSHALAAIPGMKVSVLTDVNAGGSKTNPEVDVLSLIEGWRFKDVSTIARTIRTWKPDVMHIQYPSQGYRGWLPWLMPWLLAGRRLPIVQTWHEYFLAHGAGVRTTLVALRARDVVVVRPDYEQHIAPRFRTVARRIRFHTIPNAASMPKVDLMPGERNALRGPLTPGGETLLVFFGFMLWHKGADMLFDLAEPSRDRLVFVGDVDVRDPYHQSLLRRAHSPDWDGKATFTGYLPPLEAAKWLAVADAVALPFRTGGGLWNSSIHGAVLQGTFVLTTSTDKRGYSREENVYYSAVGDVGEMRQALRRYAGHSRSGDAGVQLPDWQGIALAHTKIYSSLVEGDRSFNA